MNNKITQKIKGLPLTSGIYIFRDSRNKVIYVGKALSLKKRVSSYFQKKEHDPKTTELVKNIHNLEWLETGSEFEALIVEADFIKRYKPKYNIRLKDDKNYIYIKITAEEYPRVSLVRQMSDSGARYLGPYTDATALREILKVVRYIYPYCSCEKKNGAVCLYYHLGLCPGHDKDRVSTADYKKNIRGIVQIMTGHGKRIELDLKQKMAKAARDLDFEGAAEFRNKLHYLKKIKSSNFISDRELSSDMGLSELKSVLGLKNIPKRVECFDISNIMGTSAVGSMVVFKDGIASPKDYRRFQIKTVKGANDFAMLAEILKRRFSVKGTASFANSLPDMVVLDGGKGQLSTVLKNVEIPAGVKVIALAKRLEEIFVMSESDFTTIKLKEGGEAFFLIQRIRDEAHRFAITYYRKLKSRELFETSLDSIPGIGPKTKKRLISRFGSIRKIKVASPEELASVIPEKLAQRVKENL